MTKLPKEMYLVLLFCGGVLALLILKEVFAYLKGRDKAQLEEDKIRIETEKKSKEAERPRCLNDACVTLALDKVERVEADTRELVKCLSAQVTISSQMAKTLEDTKNILGRLTGIIGKKVES
jgi:hypothetical protein